MSQYKFTHTIDGDVIATKDSNVRQSGYFMPITDNIVMTVDGDKYMATGVGNKTVNISNVSLSDIDPVKYPTWL